LKRGEDGNNGNETALLPGRVNHRRLAAIGHLVDEAITPDRVASNQQPKMLKIDQPPRHLSKSTPRMQIYPRLMLSLDIKAQAGRPDNNDLLVLVLLPGQMLWHPSRIQPLHRRLISRLIRGRRRAQVPIHRQLARHLRKHKQPAHPKTVEEPLIRPVSVNPFFDMPAIRLLRSPKQVFNVHLRDPNQMAWRLPFRKIEQKYLHDLLP